jgi:hypothetical protein
MSNSLSLIEPTPNHFDNPESRFASVSYLALFCTVSASWIVLVLLEQCELSGSYLELLFGRDGQLLVGSARNLLRDMEG